MSFFEITKYNAHTVIIKKENVRFTLFDCAGNR